MAERTATLSWPEFVEAAHTGYLRWSLARLLGSPDPLDQDRPYPDRLLTDIGGAAAEKAYAKLHGSYWGASTDSYKARPDVGLRYPMEVRWTPHEGGHLLLRPAWRGLDGDPLDRLYALMVGAPPSFTYVGWIKGQEGARPEFLRREGRPAWWVPQSALYGIPGVTRR